MSHKTPNFNEKFEYFIYIDKPNSVNNHNAGTMKIKLPFLILLTLFSQLSIAQKKEGHINWEESRPLAWADFKGRADNSSPFDALTMGNIGYSFEEIKPNTEYKLILNISFEQKKSWVKSKRDTERLLAHEQLHFDIFELHLRMLVKKIEDEKVLTGLKFSDKLSKVYNKTYGELVKFQEKYDKETNHSKNEEKQKEWQEKVQKMLDEYKPYAKREIAFKVTK